LPDGGLRIWLHGGEYRQEKPLPLGPEDSGIPGKPTAWLPFPGEKPIIINSNSMPPPMDSDKPR